MRLFNSWAKLSERILAIGAVCSLLVQFFLRETFLKIRPYKEFDCG